MERYDILMRGSDKEFEALLKEIKENEDKKEKTGKFSKPLS